ncbi:MAG: hypothetical protein QXD05_00055 [Candidatus Pacearchaeota archaeon]
MRNENPKTIYYESITNSLRIHDENNIKIILNAIDTAIREYQVKMKKFIPNAFKFFAELCGYKSQNQIYSIIEMRKNYDLKIKDAKIIYDETGDERILEAIITYFKIK